MLTNKGLADLAERGWAYRFQKSMMLAVDAKKLTGLVYEFTMYGSLSERVCSGCLLRVAI